MSRAPQLDCSFARTQWMEHSNWLGVGPKIYHWGLVVLQRDMVGRWRAISHRSGAGLPPKVVAVIAARAGPVGQVAGPRRDSRQDGRLDDKRPPLWTCARRGSRKRPISKLVELVSCRGSVQFILPKLAGRSAMRRR